MYFNTVVFLVLYCMLDCGQGHSMAGLAGSRAELAPSCLEQSDKLNATPTNTSVLLLLYPPCFFLLFPTFETTLEPPRPAPQWVQGAAC